MQTIMVEDKAGNTKIRGVNKVIRNVFLKKIMKNTIFPFLTLVNKIIPKKDMQILLYSANGGICHSLVPIREYLLEHGYDRKYRIICGIEKLEYAEKDKLEYCRQIKALFYFLCTKHVFYTAGQIPVKPSKQQIVIHLGHGNANFKACGSLTDISNGDEFFFTYMAASSELFIPSMVREYRCKRDNIAVIGDPLLDKLLTVKEKYDLGQYKKVLLWVPTFRQSDYLGYDDSDMEEMIPLFTEDDYDDLNRELGERQIRLIVKLHPMQNIKKKCLHNDSYLNLYSDSEFRKEGFELYNLMAQVDGLIGDYSSTSLQYLLADKPQAYVVPDIAEYKEKRGFIFSDPETYMAGHIIKEKKEFWSFLDDIICERDIYAEKRAWVRGQAFQYTDNQNCKRAIRLSRIHL